MAAAAVLAGLSVVPAATGAGKPQLRGTIPPPPAIAKPGNQWSATEIAAAKAECTGLLNGLDLDFSYLPPLRQGQCGAA